MVATEGDWVIVSTFRDSGDKAYWGTIRSYGDSREGWTPKWTNSRRYVSREAAYGAAEDYREAGRLGREYTVEQLPGKPSLKDGPH